MKAHLWLWICGGIAAAMPAQEVLVQPSLTVEILPISTLVARKALQTAVQRVMNSGPVRDMLDGADHRLVQVDNLYGSGNDPKRERNSLRAVIADYTNGQTIYASLNDMDGPLTDLSMAIDNVQHVPPHEEMLAAAKIAGFGPDAVCHLRMPPVLQEMYPNGSTSRVINMAVRAKDAEKFTSVHVDMAQRSATIIQQATHAATTTTTAAPQCTSIVPASGQPGLKKPAGAARVKIKQGSTLLWELEVFRPGQSSGNKGSGVELRNVRYKDKLVLKRAHVPMLNVNYLDKSSSCGPYYRDWQDQEHPFTCNGQDVDGIAGFRLCTEPSKTVVDKPYKDGGNFYGVAFDVYKDEVVLRSQLEAGWYRYTSEWRLRANGDILPRWGFAGVSNSGLQKCVCFKHHHHVYWRFDFDITKSKPNVFRECDGTRCTDVLKESRREKKPGRRWQVANENGNLYELYAGNLDGTDQDPKSIAGYPAIDLGYGVGDLWLVNFQEGIFDDGYTDYVPISGATNGKGTDADFSKLMTGADTKNQDIVVWYSAHYMHDQPNDREDSNHVVGPSLIRGKWD